MPNLVQIVGIRERFNAGENSVPVISKKKMAQVPFALLLQPTLANPDLKAGVNDDDFELDAHSRRRLTILPPCLFFGYARCFDWIKVFLVFFKPHFRLELCVQ
jgi:hypothetical protein